MNKLLCVLTLAFTTLSCQAANENNVVKEVGRLLEGTNFVRPMTQSSEGITDACGFEFNAITFDYAYKQGEPIVVAGSFAMRADRKESIYLAYKIGTSSLGDIAKTEAPFSGWLKIGGVLIQPLTKEPSDSAGYTLFISRLPKDGAKVFDAIANLGEVKVGFNRRPRGLDVVAPLDLSVRDIKVENGQVLRQRDNSMGVEFLRCLDDLITQISIKK